MIEIDGDKIGVTKGDTGQFTISFTGTDAPTANDTILVSLKKTKTSENVLWEKRLRVNNSSVLVTLTQEDTNHPFGQYYWDARILYRDGTVYTPMDPASFKILEVVGNV